MGHPVESSLTNTAFSGWNQAGGEAWHERLGVERPRGSEGQAEGDPRLHDGAGREGLRQEDQGTAGKIVKSRLPDGKIGSLPFLGLHQGGGRGGAIQGKEGIKFCSVA